MLILTTSYYKDKERGEVFAGTLLSYTDEERAKALIRAGVAKEAEVIHVVTKHEQEEAEKSKVEAVDTSE